MLLLGPLLRMLGGLQLLDLLFEKGPLLLVNQLRVLSDQSVENLLAEVVRVPQVLQIRLQLLQER